MSPKLCQMVGALNGHAVSEWQSALDVEGVGHEAILKARSVLSAVMEAAVASS